MAIGIYFSPAAMSAEKYDECVKSLKEAGAGNPAGRSFHAAFDKFAKTLTPILQQLGIDTGQPVVMPVHKVIVPKPKVK